MAQASVSPAAPATKKQRAQAAQRKKYADLLREELEYNERIREINVRMRSAESNDLENLRENKRRLRQRLERTEEQLERMCSQYDRLSGLPPAFGRPETLSYLQTEGSKEVHVSSSPANLPTREPPQP